MLIASFIHSVIHSFTQSVSPLLPSLLLPPLPLPPSLTAIVLVTQLEQSLVLLALCSRSCQFPLPVPIDGLSRDLCWVIHTQELLLCSPSGNADTVLYFLSSETQFEKGLLCSPLPPSLVKGKGSSFSCFLPCCLLAWWGRPERREGELATLGRPLQTGFHGRLGRRGGMG